MPRFAEFTDQRLEDLRHYIRQQADRASGRGPRGESPLASREGRAWPGRYERQTGVRLPRKAPIPSAASSRAEVPDHRGTGRVVRLFERLIDLP